LSHYSLSDDDKPYALKAAMPLLCEIFLDWMSCRATVSLPFVLLEADDKPVTWQVAIAWNILWIMLTVHLEVKGLSPLLLVWLKMIASSMAQRCDSFHWETFTSASSWFWLRIVATSTPWSWWHSQVKHSLTRIYANRIAPSLARDGGTLCALKWHCLWVKHSLTRAYANRIAPSLARDGGKLCALKWHSLWMKRLLRKKAKGLCGFHL
jgi:Fe-S cluster biogenesis protein NfuA